MNNYVLAMYDVRGKQNFIYRTNKLKEIQGASLVIRDLFKDYLYDNRIYLDNKTEDSKENEGKHVFNYMEFEKHMNSGDYDGQLLYEGGGNLFVLFKDEDICKKYTKKFSEKLIEETGTLNVNCTYIELGDPNDFKDGAYKKIYTEHRKNESQEIASPAYGVPPIVMVDPTTSQPIVERKRYRGDEVRELSTEMKVKLDKFNKADNLNEGKNLDDILIDDDDSLLAVIYIDGNNMGAKVRQKTEGKNEIDECVNALRDFSKEIQNNYIDEPIKEINKLLEGNNKKDAKRIVISAGDEITVICDAENALDVTKTYLDKLPKDGSSCAGIAIFRSHTPFRDAYRIAEECCESGKKRMKANREENACYIDYHYCQGAIDLSLEKIREDENNQNASLPWLYREYSDGNAQDSEGNANIEASTKFKDVEKMANILKIMGHSNTKNLLQPAKESEKELGMEIERILAHMNEENKEKIKSIDSQALNSYYYTKILICTVLLTRYNKSGYVISQFNDYLGK